MANAAAVREQYREREETVKKFKALWHDYMDGKLTQAQYLERVRDAQRDIERRKSQQQSLPLVPAEKVVHS